MPQATWTDSVVFSKSLPNPASDESPAALDLAAKTAPNLDRRKYMI
jgi:hypothetical protein